MKNFSSCIIYVIAALSSRSLTILSFLFSLEFNQTKKKETCYHKTGKVLCPEDFPMEENLILTPETPSMLYKRLLTERFTRALIIHFLF